MNKIILKDLQQEGNIYLCNFINTIQEDEIKLRDNIAMQFESDYLSIISKSHSIPVMDIEVERFLLKIPANGNILDVGGCWGWHWRNIHKLRPDVNIFILDFVKSNLKHAEVILKELVNKNVFLIHGDATNLIFDDSQFDGYWSVQTLQHIPNYEKVIKEGHRVLKSNGYFVNYSLNNQWIVKLIYKLFGKYYHISGYIPNTYYLSRLTKEQIFIVESIFNREIVLRYSEILYKPELRITFTGKEKSYFAKIDSFLSNNYGLFSGLARQVSFHIKKD